jgi:hypothetical protein
LAIGVLDLLHSEQGAEECDATGAKYQHCRWLQKISTFYNNPQKLNGSGSSAKTNGENIPHFNESAILGFSTSHQKIGGLFLSTKCVNLELANVVIFFKLWKTMENHVH